MPDRRDATPRGSSSRNCISRSEPARTTSETSTASLSVSLQPLPTLADTARLKSSAKIGAAEAAASGPPGIAIHTAIVAASFIDVVLECSANVGSTSQRVDPVFTGRQRTSSVDAPCR